MAGTFQESTQPSLVLSLDLRTAGSSLASDNSVMLPDSDPEESRLWGHVDPQDSVKSMFQGEKSQAQQQENPGATGQREDLAGTSGSWFL